MNAAELLRRIRSNGSDADSIRDAAHEACHAVQTKTRAPWTRDRLHEAIEKLADRQFEEHSRLRRARMSRMDWLVRYELQARAVEMLVCQKFEEEYNIEHWAMICWEETAKAYRLNLANGDIDQVVDAIQVCSKQLQTKLLLDRVLAIRGRKA